MSDPVPSTPETPFAEPPRGVRYEEPLKVAPSRQLEAPHNLRGLIEDNTSGLRRIKLIWIKGRSESEGIAALAFAKPEFAKTTPPEVVDRAIEMLMAAATAHIDHQNQRCKYRAELYHVNQHDKSERGKSTEFSLSPSFMSSSDDEPESKSLDEIMKFYLASANNQLLKSYALMNATMEQQNKTTAAITAHTEVVTTRLSDALIRERAATQAEAEARRERDNVTEETKLRLAELAQREKFFDQVMPLVHAGLGQVGPKVAEGLKKKKKSPDNPLSRTKAKAEAKAKDKANGESKDEAEPKPTKKVDIESLKEDHPTLYMVKKFIDSLDDETSTKLSDILDEEAFEVLAAADETKTDAECVAVLSKLNDLFDESKVSDVMEILDSQQKPVLISIYQKVKAASG